MSYRTKTYTLPESYSRQRLAALYRALPISDDIIKLLRKYLKAMINLYGVIPLDKVYEIINTQNPGLLTKAEFAQYIMVARHEREYFAIFGEADEYTGTRFETSLNRMLVDQYLLEINKDYLNKVKACQADKPYYIPQKNILLRYHDPCYYEPTLQSKVMKSFWHDMIGYSAESAKNIFLDLQLIARTVDSTMDDVMEMLEKDKLSQHLSKAQMTLFLDLYQDMHNHTRMQCNRGHTPEEISAMMPRGKGALQSISLGQNIRDSLKDGTLNMEDVLNHFLTMELPNEDVRKDLLRQLEAIRKEMPMPEPQVKVGRNALCPCGSGKKYKKCCGK